MRKKSIRLDREIDFSETDDVLPSCNLNSTLFTHYNQCPYKAYLTFSGAFQEQAELEFFFSNQHLAYRTKALAQVSSNIIGRAPTEFSTTKKIDAGLKLNLAYEVLASDPQRKKPPKYGQIIYGSNYSKTKFALKKYLAESKKVLVEIEKITNENKIPIFTLNSHCKVCRYQAHCRQKAIQSDDLSLMSAISKKEIGKLNRRGIFTVTQLGHSFSPQRRRMKVNAKHLHALKALAIKDKKIYVNHPPLIPVKKEKLFLDVEGLPDRDEYYLIGLKSVTDAGEKTCHCGPMEDRENMKSGRLFSKKYFRTTTTPYFIMAPMKPIS
jgi:predicted RecB family nuclease